MKKLKKQNIKYLEIFSNQKNNRRNEMQFGNSEVARWYFSSFFFFK